MKRGRYHNGLGCSLSPIDLTGSRCDAASRGAGSKVSQKKRRVMSAHHPAEQPRNQTEAKPGGLCNSALVSATAADQAMHDAARAHALLNLLDARQAITHGAPAQQAPVQETPPPPPPPPGLVSGGDAVSSAAGKDMATGDDCARQRIQMKVARRVQQGECDRAQKLARGTGKAPLYMTNHEMKQRIYRSSNRSCSERNRIPAVGEMVVAREPSVSMECNVCMVVGLTNTNLGTMIQ